MSPFEKELRTRAQSETFERKSCLCVLGRQKTSKPLEQSSSVFAYLFGAAVELFMSNKTIRMQIGSWLCFSKRTVKCVKHERA